MRNHNARLVHIIQFIVVSLYLIVHFSRTLSWKLTIYVISSVKGHW